MKTSKKHIGIWLLLCCLFLTGYLSGLNSAAVIPANVSDLSSIGGGNEHSSMNGGENFGHFYSAIDAANLSLISAGQSRGQVIKIKFNLLNALAAALLISFVCSSRLSYRVCTPFNSLSIITFLHKKDGMK